MHICLIAIKVKSGTIWQTIPQIKGEEGESAYEIAVRNGFEGTEEEWLEYLRQGPQGEDGLAGRPGDNYQFIFKRTDSSNAPFTPESATDVIPETWSAFPLGVNAIAKYEWVSVRVKVDNVWGEFSAPALWAIYGFGDSLPEIYIEDIENLQDVLDDLQNQIDDKISKSLLPDPNTVKLPGADIYGVVLPKYLPIATANSLGAIKVGSTLTINAETGVLNTNIGFRNLTDSALEAEPPEGASIVWNSTSKKYVNTVFSLSGTYHPYLGKDAQGNKYDLWANILRPDTLILPKELPTVANNEVAIYAKENGYSIIDPGEISIRSLDNLEDVTITNVQPGDSLFREGEIYVNKPALTKSQIQALFTGLSTTYHPYGGSFDINFSANELKSNALYLPTTPPAAGTSSGVMIFAKENGYSLENPENLVAEFMDLSDIKILTWADGQTIIRRNGYFTNEAIYNKDEIDTIISGLSMDDYFTKIESIAKFHPKYGLEGETPLNLTANRLKSNSLILPKSSPDVYDNEVALFALENGYSIEEPSTNAYGNLADLEDVDIENLDNNQALFYNFITNKWVNKTVTFDMIPDSLSADKVSTTEFKRFVTDAQITSWNNKWTFDIDVIKGIKVDNAVNADKLGGIDANKYWHDTNSNLFTVDWKAKVLRSKILVIPKEIPVDLGNNEVGIFSLENGYSIQEPSSGSLVEILDDLADVINTAPQPNDVLIYNNSASAYVNGPMTFDKISGMLQTSQVQTGSSAKFVTDAQIGFWNAKEDASNKNQASGYLGLNSNKKIDFIYLPDVILGQVKYGGTITINGIISSPFAELNGLDIDTLSASAYTGYFFIAQVDGIFVSIETKIGDWIISNGTAGWAKVDNTDAVTSINGRIGAIILSKSDVGLSNVDNTADADKNVLSATKLFTARTLWGQSFNGTENVSGSLTSVTHITGTGILNMGAILIPKVIYPDIPNNTVAIYAVENGYSIVEPEGGSVGNLDDLLDVELVTRANKQLLYYNSDLEKFTNGIIDFSYISGNLASSRITDSPEFRFVTDAEKLTWYTKQSKLTGTQDSSNGSLVRVNTLGVVDYDNTSYATVSQLSGYALLAGSVSQAFSVSSLTASNVVVAGGNKGFQNDIYYANVANPIWAFGNAPTYGISYYQGTALSAVGDAIGFHFGNVASPVFYVSSNGDIRCRDITINGVLSGATIGSFSGLLTANQFTTSRPTSNSIMNNLGYYGKDGYWGFRSDTDNNFNLDVYGNGSLINALKVLQSSGAATFSSSVSAASFTSGGNAVLHAGNYSSYALPLSGGILSGLVTFNGSALFSNTFSLYVRRPSEGNPNIVMQNLDSGGSVRTLGYITMLSDDNLGFFRADGASYRTVIHSGNIGSQSVNYAAWAGRINVYSGNEMWLANGFAGGGLWLNYRGATSAITNVYVGNGIGDGVLTYLNAQGFIKAGSSSSYLLLGDGGHKAVSDFATAGHTHNSFYTKYLYPNNIISSTTAVTLSGNNENITGMFYGPSIWGAGEYANAFVYTGYNEYGSTQLITLYNATNGNNKMAFRVYNQVIGGYNNFTEVWTKDNLTNTLSNGYLPYWNGSSLVNSPIYTNASSVYLDVLQPYSGQRLTLLGGGANELFVNGSGYFATTLQAGTSLTAPTITASTALVLNGHTLTIE